MGSRFVIRDNFRRRVWQQICHSRLSFRAEQGLTSCEIGYTLSINKFEDESFAYQHLQKCELQGSVTTVSVDVRYQVATCQHMNE